MPKRDYKKKSDSFVSGNSFIAYKPTEQCQKAVGCSLNNDKNVIQRTKMETG
jgi:hypothetical protein